MGEIYSVVILAALVFIIAPVLAVLAFRRAGKLEKRVALLETQFKSLEDGEGELAPAAIPEDLHDAQTENDQQALVPDIETEIQTTPSTLSDPPPEDPWRPQIKEPLEARSLEEIFASQWLVWLGGLTIALAGIFLVKYSIEHQLLSPAIRVTLGFVLGVALVGGGEWLRQRPLQRAIASVQANFVPPALTGAGVMICFGSVYASYALFGLLAPLIVFVLLALIAVGAMALSLLQGPLIAALGILGAFAVPLLVSTGSGSAWGLFPYLLVVAASAFAVVRYKEWWWLAWAALSGAALWDILWVVVMWRQGDLTPTSIHMLSMFCFAVAVRFEDIKKRAKAMSLPFNILEMSSHERLLTGAAVMLAILAFAVVRIESYGTGSLAVLGIVTILLIGIALRASRLEVVAVIAAALPLVLLMTWHVPGIVTLPEHITLGGRDLGALRAPIVPPEFSMFAVVAGVTAVWFGIAGYFGIGRSKSTAYWAAVSAAVPLLSLTIAFWRMSSVGVDLAWAAVAMGLASAATMAAVRIGKNTDAKHLEPALGVYVLAVIAGISLAATMTLENAWLTVALAVQLPAIAWVHNRFGIDAIRWVSFVVALIVGARLLLAHQFPGADWALPRDPIWILYGYGIPAIAFAVAARWFRQSGDDRLVMTLESGAIAIAVATVSMEIRYFVGTWTANFWRYSLLEQSLHSLSWLASGYGLYRRYGINPRWSNKWGAVILIGLASAQILLLQLLDSNPAFTGESVGEWMIVDVLTLAYLAPAVLALLIFFEARRQGHAKVMIGAGSAVGILLFCYITLEVRHFFHGSKLDRGMIGNAEGYTYSVVWLLYAASLFAVGFLWRIAVVRHAALALTLLIVAKVFLWDMSGLTGLYRVASFLGLGLSLVAIGYFYQRFMFQKNDGDPAVPTTEQGA